MGHKQNNNKRYVVAALYHFADLADFEAIQQPLLKLCRDHGIKGTLILASEGINGTICGTRDGIDTVLRYIHDIEALNNLEHKESFCDEMAFRRMRVKIKDEIVTLGVGKVDVLNNTGEHLETEAWNRLISDPETFVIDTRNDYEIDIGTFKNAISPHTDTFREFIAYLDDHLANQKNKNIAMFCTGGIRCEKATAYMKEQGYENVYQLKGGILKYMETTPQDESLWQGECFVFDDRVAVNHNLEVGSYDLCFGCREPISAQDKESELFEDGVTCPKCFADRTEEQKKASRERQKQINLAKKRQICHIGDEAVA